MLMNSRELQTRLKKFALRLLPLCEALPKKKISQIIEDQLLRSGFSAAANYRSACNGQSKKAFNSKLSIVLEEIDDLHLLKHEKLELIINEALQLTKILGGFKKNHGPEIES